MVITRIKNESMLLDRLKTDIDGCGKKKLVLQAGHFPLTYHAEGAREAFDEWGPFSRYSLELGCQIGDYAKTKGKDVEFVFLVDDHTYESMGEVNCSQVKSRKRRLFKEKSGPNSILHPEYEKTMNQYGFSTEDVLRHDHGKKGRNDCLYFSEKVLRASLREINNICAREYTEFIENPGYFDKKNSHIVSFVPNRCQGHVCGVALDLEIDNISSSHVFMETMDPEASREDLYGFFGGVTYRRDLPENENSKI
jgi:hypothetical protein